MRFKLPLFFAVLFAGLLAARLCHAGILWAEETLPLAAAGQMIRGHALYRDIWFDKPPLLAWLYLLWGGAAGWPLRVAGALYSLLASWLAFRFARDLWSSREGYWAASLLAFFLTFDLPSAVMPLASDMLLVAPHIGAVWLAWKRRPFWSGLLLGVGFLISPKAALLAVVCALWYPAGTLRLALGCVAVNAAAALWLMATGALTGYWDQVWRWGRLYAADSFLQEPLWSGIVRTAGWAGFHAAALAAAFWYFARGRKAGESPTPLQWAVWCGLSVVGVAAGWRFFPRYYFLLLPLIVIAAARGFTSLGRRGAWAALLLVIPLARFGPRYALLASGQTDWADTAMDRDSRVSATLTRTLARRGDTLFVWGFRPELYIYTGMPAASRFLDSQPLTGVPADRHLTQSAPVDAAAARAHRAELIESSPAFVVDGLGLYNPQLAITGYDDLRDWLSRYREVARSHGAVVYGRTPGP